MCQSFHLVVLVLVHYDPSKLILFSFCVQVEQSLFSNVMFFKTQFVQTHIGYCIILDQI